MLQGQLSSRTCYNSETFIMQMFSQC